MFVFHKHQTKWHQLKTNFDFGRYLWLAKLWSTQCNNWRRYGMNLDARSTFTSSKQKQQQKNEWEKKRRKRLKIKLYTIHDRIMWIPKKKNKLNRANIRFQVYNLTFRCSSPMCFGRLRQSHTLNIIIFIFGLHWRTPKPADLIIWFRCEFDEQTHTDFFCWRSILRWKSI